MGTQAIPKKKRCLLCFSRRDADGKAELAAHLAAAGSALELWSVDKLSGGETIPKAFLEAAASADAALLLLSADFFDGLSNHLPGEPAEHSLAWQVEEIRRQHEERGIRLVPIVWRPCDWSAVDWLANLKPLSADGSALTLMDKAQRDQALADIARHLSGRARPSVRGILGGLRREVGIEMPSRATLIAKSCNLLAMNESAFEKAVDLSLRVQQVPQLVRAQHVPHGGARSPEEARPLEEDLLGYLLRAERLLLVGQPGSGKTQTLRTLCGQMLEAARQDPSLPVPFLVNFSSFSNYRGTLRDWLAEGLKESATMPIAIGQALLRQGQLFLLLDGLDEMAAELREVAVVELNALMASADPALARCVVCSRTKEYSDVRVRLMLPAALELQPLPPSQVREAVEQAGPPAASLRTAMAEDPTLETLLQTPLLLTVAVRAFAGTQDLALAGHSPVELRKLLYDAYLTQMLQRTTANLMQRTALTLHRLRWLAQHLLRERESLFLIERLQPAILSVRRNYQIGYGLALGLVFGLLVGLIGVWVYGLTRGLIVGFVIGLILGRAGGFDVEPIKPVEQLHWSWAKALGGWESHLLLALIGWLFGTMFFGQDRMLGLGLGSGLIGGLTSFVSDGWVKTDHGRSGKPNQGIRSSLYHGLQEGMLGGLVIGMLGGLAIWLGGGWSGGPAGGLAIGLVGGLGIGIYSGLGEALKHYLLRLFLWREGKLALRLVPWLESCRARLLLRRQGGAYMFWHKTLQDYFAELDDARLAELAKRIEARPVYEQSY